jgi:hypothetical protein
VSESTLESEPVSCWFSLTYSSYMVLHRVALESMPAEWQRKFIALIEQMQAELQTDLLPSEFMVKARVNGKFITDDWAQYRHRRLPPRSEP